MTRNRAGPVITANSITGISFPKTAGRSGQPAWEGPGAVRRWPGWLEIREQLNARRARSLKLHENPVSEQLTSANHILYPDR